MEELSDKVKKNLFDLDYNRYLQYFNACIILIFTYLIGLLIAMFTKQIIYSNPQQIAFIILISTLFLGSLFFLVIYFRKSLAETREKIKELNL